MANVSVAILSGFIDNTKAEGTPPLAEAILVFGSDERITERNRKHGVDAGILREKRLRSRARCIVGTGGGLGQRWNRRGPRNVPSTLGAVTCRIGSSVRRLRCARTPPPDRSPGRTGIPSIRYTPLPAAFSVPAPGCPGLTFLRREPCDVRPPERSGCRRSAVSYACLAS